MFKDREVIVRMGKRNTTEEATETSTSPEKFEVTADIVLRKLEKIGAKMFLGVCIYVILDTRRQVTVARASNPYQQ